ncbi:ELMO domain-containing protein 3 [Nothoprocta perdicaria]|uniref:ELMO domain-containing protein 3 n=1 Tax=Nothoprocta perdicaria TaxID=30464 RepID=UPI000E1C2BB4|nr:ELMO domain-containing protein 3 [Nothoprocta perdicaria]
MEPLPARRHGRVLQAQAAGPPAPEPCEEQRRAQQEWEAVQSGQPGLPAEPPGAAALISFEEALRYFQSAELAECRKAIPARPRRRGLASLLHMLFGPPRLRAPLQAERDLALAIARCALDDSERVHVRILQTIYRRLTRSPLGCPRYGAHWEELGFQGADPGTDLRGTGMLGLLQMLHFVTDPRTLPLARKIFKLSQHETQHFPFCVVSVNVTRIVVRALRDERLSRECNRRRQVLAVLNDVYVGAFLRLYGAWTARRGALPDAGALLSELETFTKKKPRQLLKALESYLSGSAAAPAGAREDRDFTGICDLPAEAADAVRPL